MRITPPSLPGGGVDDLLPDVGGLDEGGASGPVPSHGADLADAGGYSLGYDEAPLPLAMEMEAMDAAEEAAAAAAAAGGGARRTPQRRRRKATVDVGRDGRPATTLSSGARLLEGGQPGWRRACGWPGGWWPEAARKRCSHAAQGHARPAAASAWRTYAPYLGSL